MSQTQPKEQAEVSETEAKQKAAAILEQQKMESSDGKSQSTKTGVALRSGAAPAKSGKTTGLQKAAGIARAVAPYVGKMLPLLEGNVAAVVTSLFAGRHDAPRVDLQPLESSITRMRKDHIDLRLSVADQTASLKRIADQVETVKESVEKSRLESKELGGEVQVLRGRVNLFAWIGLVLLLISILVNIALFEQIRHLVR